MMKRNSVNKKVVLGTVIIFTAIVFGFLIWVWFFHVDGTAISDLDTATRTTGRNTTKSQKTTDEPAFSKGEDAAYWERRALDSAEGEDRDAALISWLKALEIEDTNQRRSEVVRLISKDYKLLQATFRLEQGDELLGFSADGTKSIVVNSQKKEVRIWNHNSAEDAGTRMGFVTSGFPLLTLGNNGVVATKINNNSILVLKDDVVRKIKYTSGIDTLTISPDGKKLLFSGEDKSLQVWNTLTAAPINQAIKLDSPVSVANFSPDGEKIVLCTRDGKVRLFQTTSLVPVVSPLIHEKEVTLIAFSGDGKKLLTATGEKRVNIWSFDSKKPTRVTLSVDSTPVAIRFSPDNKKVAVVSHNEVQLWNTTHFEKIGKKIAHPFEIGAFTFSPDSKLLAIADKSGIVQLWQTATGKPTSVPLRYNATSLVFSADGKSLYTGGKSLVIRKWQVRNEMAADNPTYCRAVFDKNIVAYSPDGADAVWVDGGTFEVVKNGSTELSPDRSIGKTKPDVPTQEKIYDAAIYNRDGTRLLTIARLPNGGGNVQLWKIGDSALQFIGSINHDQPIITASFSVHRDRTLIADQGFRTVLVNVESAQPIGESENHRQRIFDVDLNPDGNIAAAGGNRFFWLWNVPANLSLGKPVEIESKALRVAFSDDGNRILVGTGETTVEKVLVYDSETLTRIATLPNFEEGVVFVSADRSADVIALATPWWLHQYKWSQKNSTYIHHTSTLFEKTSYCTKFDYDVTKQDLKMIFHPRRFQLEGNTVNLDQLRNNENIEELLPANPIQLRKKWEKRLGFARQHKR